VTESSIKENKNKGTKSFKIKGYHFTLLLILAISFLIFCKQLNFFFFFAKSRGNVMLGLF